jgi:hypothetical protein
MKTITGILLSLLLVLPFSSCGTLMFKERQGQPHQSSLDPNVVIMDSLGLLLFVLPGLVAFGVDFSTQAIYLPEGVVKGEGPFISDTAPASTKASVSPDE